MRQYVAAVSFILCALIGNWSFANSQTTTAETFGSIQPSLALVLVYRDAKLVGSGSAFCVNSNGYRSLFLTNRHVIAAGNRYFLLVQSIGSTPIQAQPIRAGNGDLDLAVLSIRRGNITSVVLDSTLPQPGTPVSVAGYPVTQLTEAALNLGLSPAVHAGTVNALPGNGFYIQFDAQLEHGNSGGPLYDSTTGRVYGVASAKYKLGEANENNFAISIGAAQQFLQNVHVGVAGAQTSKTFAATSSGNAACKAGLQMAGKAFDRYINDYASVFTTMRTLEPLTNRFSQVSPKESRQVAADMASIIQSAVSQLSTLSTQDEPMFDSATDAVQKSGAQQTADIMRQLSASIKKRDAAELQYLQSWYEAQNGYATTGRFHGVDSSYLTVANAAYGDFTPEGQALQALPACSH